MPRRSSTAEGGRDRKCGATGGDGSESVRVGKETCGGSLPAHPHRERHGPRGRQQNRRFFSSFSICSNTRPRGHFAFTFLKWSSGSRRPLLHPPSLSLCLSSSPYLSASLSFSLPLVLSPRSAALGVSLLLLLVVVVLLLFPPALPLRCSTQPARRWVAMLTRRLLPATLTLAAHGLRPLPLLARVATPQRSVLQRAHRRLLRAWH